MTKPTTDSGPIDALLNRGVSAIYPSSDALREALGSGKRLRIYNGMDPTASTLHIGHLAVLQKLRQFQDLGHEVMLLVGDVTGMIGDPTGKTSARVPLTRMKVEQHAEQYQEQASAVLAFSGPNAATVRRNSEWWDEMSVPQFLATLAVTTAQRLLERDMFQDRIKDGKPIGAHELVYPVLQGYDSVAMEVDVEIGGTDQMFNMMMGRDFVKKVQDREKFVITVPLLADASGKKIGKSEGNMVALGTDANDLYGKTMALPDGVLEACLTQCTALPMDEIASILNEHPRDAKMRLAWEVTKMMHGKDAADTAQEVFVKTFQEHETPDAIPEVVVQDAEWSLVDLLGELKLASSKSDARRVIEQGGVKVSDVVVDDVNASVVITSEGVVIQKGKRYFIRVVHRV
jgi:tyrosyl-tRNA synthetase